VALPAPERPVNHSVNPRPYLLLPYSPIPSSCVLSGLLLESAGLLDHLLLVPQALHEDLYDFQTRNLEDDSSTHLESATRRRTPAIRPRKRLWRATTPYPPG
jgi:hypothetical protein